MEKKNIVILGAGFGGITAALTLAKGMDGYTREYEIILVDRHHHQLYTPALYEIASTPTELASDQSLKTSILIPIADIIAGTPIRFLADECTKFNLNEKKVIFEKNGEMQYEMMIFALGSETNYFDIPGLKEYGYTLKTFDDALRLRNAVESLLKKGRRAEVVIGGAGSSGIEVAAEFINFFCAIGKEIVGRKNTCEINLCAVEASPQILPGFKPAVVALAAKRLNSLGITAKTGARIQSVDGQKITFQDGKEHPYDILVWAGGVKGPAILARTGLALSEKGALITNKYLEVPGGENSIFAIGDNAATTNPRTGEMLLWNVPVAEAEGRSVAKNILALIRGQSKKAFIPMPSYPFILSLGRKYAIADLVYFQLSGRLGWCIKQLTELRYLLFILPWRAAIGVWTKGIKIYIAND